MKGRWIIMKKYYAYVVKDMIDYFEEELMKRGVIIINRELIKNYDSEFYYYIVEAKDGIIDPRFEVKGA
jgi:hypothetical protein